MSRTEYVIKTGKDRVVMAFDSEALARRELANRQSKLGVPLQIYRRETVITEERVA